MIFPVFTIFLIFLIIFNINARKTSRRDEAIKRSIFERERRANNTRKKSLQGLNYIHIPDTIPPDITDALSGDARDAAERIRYLREENAEIVNLTGYTNTDLKLEYGVANITNLIQFDTNYAALVTALQDSAKALYEAGKYEEAKQVLEFAVQTGTDIRESYRLLIDMYKSKLFMDKETMDARLRALIPIAEDLRSLSKNAILAMIYEALHMDDKLAELKSLTVKEEPAEADS